MQACLLSSSTRVLPHPPTNDSINVPALGLAYLLRLPGLDLIDPPTQRDAGGYQVCAFEELDVVPDGLFQVGEGKEVHIPHSEFRYGSGPNIHVV